MRFVFVDRIIELEKENYALGSKNLAMSEDYFEHHFPFFPVMPGVLMLEIMIELSSWLVIYSTDFRFFSLPEKVYQVKFRKPAQPGDILKARVQWDKRGETGILFSGRVFLEEKMITEAKFESKLIEIKNNEDKNLLKMNYQFLTTRLEDKFNQ